MMKVGLPKEIKDQEFRVGLTPAGVKALVAAGHSVHVQRSAGLGSGFDDEQYLQVGARLTSADEAWNCDLIVKVKEPQEVEYGLLHGQILFTYLHLAGAPKALTERLLASRTTAVAYETVENGSGHLPLLAPMSAVAGSMAVSIGSYYLARFNGGKGVLLGNLLGHRHGKVIIIGDGVVGQHAARAATGIGATTYICGLHAERGVSLKREISPDLEFFVSDQSRIAHHLKDADLLVGAVLVHGARAQHVVTEAMVQRMQAGSVIVDVSIDQGGCIETSRPTTHSDPVFVRHGVIHYAVTNMPGAYPRSSTMALTHATLPYVLKIADGAVAALRADSALAQGVNTYDGNITCRPVADALSFMEHYRPFS